MDLIRLLPEYLFLPQAANYTFVMYPSLQLSKEGRKEGGNNVNIIIFQLDFVGVMAYQLIGGNTAKLC